MLRAILLAFAVCFSAASAVAQEGVLAELYGRGVHHYYAGQYDEAHRYLSMAIDNGSRDPRAYYFRGLVNDATGRDQEAESDYQMGAQLEVQTAATSSVSRALTRIQGAQRLEIEAIRDQVRLQERATEAAQNRARYEQRQAAEANVLRRPRTAPPVAQPAAPRVAEPAAPRVAQPLPPTAPPDDRQNPFADDAGIAIGEPQVDAADAMPAVTDQPAATPPADAPDPASADAGLFGAPAPATGSPFGAPAPADGGLLDTTDPFDTGAAPAAPAPAAPAPAEPAAPAETAPADGAMDDPFATDGENPFAT